MSASVQWFCRSCVALMLCTSSPVFAQPSLQGTIETADDLRQNASTGLRQSINGLEFGYGRESSSSHYFSGNSGFQLGDARSDRRFSPGVLQGPGFGAGSSSLHALPGDASAGINGSLNEPLLSGRFYGFVQQNFSGGWGLGLGLRRNEYTSTNMVSILAERTWNNFRGSYSLYSDRPEGMLSEASHRFQLSYQYDDRNVFGMSYINGRESEIVSLRGLFSPDVQGWSLGGRHWLTPSWALTYDLVQQDQGALYRRQGVQLGVRRNF